LFGEFENLMNQFSRKLNLTITVAPIQLWKWQMYISQTLRQSWYGNIFGDDDKEEDQDSIKVTKEFN
jgi:hypothetical protein